ncbi:MAG TPA: hypothetical protein VKY85_05065 [Candidatus Angelobacter sp.]|nr:hypothetical protein [Candidatus Angelobacter sp.]
MVVLYGIRGVMRKVVAYRNDFCLWCEVPQRAHQIRSLKAFHIFFIPVLPLGFWRDWECSVCNRNPHGTRGRRERMGLAFFVGMFAAVAWISPGSETGNSIAVTWVLRIAFMIAFGVALWYALKNPSNIRLKEELNKIEPAQENYCTFCNSPVILNDGWRCSNCGVQRTAV